MWKIIHKHIKRSAPFSSRFCSMSEDKNSMGINELADHNFPIKIYCCDDTKITGRRYFLALQRAAVDAVWYRPTLHAKFRFVFVSKTVSTNPIFIRSVIKVF
jgi:hypothetical protein